MVKLKKYKPQISQITQMKIITNASHFLITIEILYYGLNLK